MLLTRLKVSAVLAFTAVCSATLSAQEAASQQPFQKRVSPFATIAASSIAQAGGGLYKNINVLLADLTLGARIRSTGRYTWVLAANVGHTAEANMGEDASCHIPPDGQTGCVPAKPSIGWAGASAGVELNVKRWGFAAMTGPSAFFGSRWRPSPPAPGENNGADPGLRTQLDATWLLSQHAGLTISGVNRYIPSFRGNNMRVNSLSLGLTVR